MLSGAPYFWCAICLAGLPVSPVSTETARDNVALQPIQAKLFYKSSGRLSDNILGRTPPFAGWNTVIGEGDAQEPADDLLIVLPIRAGLEGQDHQVFLQSPVAVKITDGKGNVLVQKSFKSILTSDLGWEYKAVWLDDVTCEGTINIEARFRNQLQKATLDLSCGE